MQFLYLLRKNRKFVPYFAFGMQSNIHALPEMKQINNN